MSEKIQSEFKEKVKNDPMFGIRAAMVLSAMSAEKKIIKLVEDEERRGGVAVPIKALREAIAESFINELNDTFLGEKNAE